VNEIVIVRGAHRNEISSYILAKKVFKKIEAKELPCSFETIPYNATWWNIFDRMKGKDIEGDPVMINEDLMRMNPEGKWNDLPHWSEIPPRNIFSFHNYGVPSSYFRGGVLFESIIDENENLRFIDVGEENSKIFIKNLGKIVWDPPFFHNSIGSVVFLKKRDFVTVEIPACYNEEKAYDLPWVPSEIRPYLCNVDLRRTKEGGLMNDIMVDSIAKEIIRCSR